MKVKTQCFSMPQLAFQLISWKILVEDYILGCHFHQLKAGQCKEEGKLTNWFEFLQLGYSYYLLLKSVLCNTEFFNKARMQKNCILQLNSMHTSLPNAGRANGVWFYKCFAVCETTKTRKMQGLVIHSHGKIWQFTSGMLWKRRQ